MVFGLGGRAPLARSYLCRPHPPGKRKNLGSLTLPRRDTAGDPRFAAGTARRALRHLHRSAGSGSFRARRTAGPRSADDWRRSPPRVGRTLALRRTGSNPRRPRNRTSGGSLRRGCRGTPIPDSSLAAGQPRGGTLGGPGAARGKPAAGGAAKSGRGMGSKTMACGALRSGREGSATARVHGTGECRPRGAGACCRSGARQWRRASAAVYSGAADRSDPPGLPGHCRGYRSDAFV